MIRNNTVDPAETCTALRSSSIGEENVRTQDAARSSAARKTVRIIAELAILHGDVTTPVTEAHVIATFTGSEPTDVTFVVITAPEVMTTSLLLDPVNWRAVLRY